MKILYLDHYAGSVKHGRSFRPYYLGKEWVKRGHQLTVVGGTYSHVRTVQPKEPGREDIEGIQYLWLKTPYYKHNGVKRFFSMLVFILKLFFNQNMILQLSKPDVIIASTVYMLDIFPAWIMAKRSKAKLVFELHDIWPLSPMELGNMSKWHPFIVGMRFTEWFVYKVVDRVVSILPKTYDHMKQFGIKPEQFVHVPNGIDLEDWNATESLPNSVKEQIEALRAKGLFLVCYAGSHAVSNALTNLLDAAELLKDQKVHFLLIGDGQEKEALQQYAQDKNIQNVTFLGRISKRSIPQALEMMDALYIGLQNQPLFRFGVSANKLFDYMMAKKPVIYAVTAGNDPIADADCGLSVKAENAPLLAQAVMEMMNKSTEERSRMGENGRAYVLAHHDYKVLAQEFEEALK